MASPLPRILIAEDEPRIVSFLEKGLRQNGYDTVAVSQGDRTLELLADNGFDLLLLDLGLPVQDGWSVLQELKAANRTIPIIVITASEGVGDRLQQSSDHIFSYFIKPFRFRLLLQQVRDCLAPA